MSFLTSRSLRTATRVLAPRSQIISTLHIQARYASSSIPPASHAGTSSTASENKETTDVLKKGAKRDPELYVLLAIMSGAFGLAGWYFGRKPTSSSSVQHVEVAKMPWEVDNYDEKGDYKYEYHPGGDRNNKPKKAPSALNVVIIPAMTLPKETHDRVNKWGKDDY